MKISPMICISMASLSISTFGLIQLIIAVVSLQPYGCKFLPLKPQTHSFSQPVTANKNSFQLLTALHILDPAANRKPYT